MTQERQFLIKLRHSDGELILRALESFFLNTDNKKKVARLTSRLRPMLEKCKLGGYAQNPDLRGAL